MNMQDAQAPGPVIQFECLPLRSVSRLDIPIDASPKYQAWCERVKSAIAKHGAFNSYYLHKGVCRFHLTNEPKIGSVEFAFEGTVLTDDADAHTRGCDLVVDLVRETCDWLSKPIVAWLAETVRRAVCLEFDRYIAAGDLEKTRQRLAKLNAESEAAGGFIGMHL